MTDSYAAKGSQRWLQIAIDRAPQLVDRPIRAAMGTPADVAIEWLSPLRSDRFVEYRDGATFTKCGVELSKRRLHEFWPQRGPMWDGLARTSMGDILLVEAKAHIPELVSPRSRATEPARGRIAKSMREVQVALAPKSVDYVDWTSTFYQYANRVAHLYFLRECNGVRAHLVNIYFVNALDVNGPNNPAEWQGAIKVVECYLGLGRTRLTKYMHKVFVDATPLVSLGVSADV